MQNSEVSVVWVTPNGQNLISEMARVSNPRNAKNDETAPRLIRYLIKHKHWSPFEMVNLCLSIKTSRAISRQILRHRSFTFQEFSQRYADPKAMKDFDLGLPELRFQDPKNRQNSISGAEPKFFKLKLIQLKKQAEELYEEMIIRGVAKECARSVLGEGLTPSHIYMNGTIRNWIHFCQVRIGNGTQKEHSEIAEKVWSILEEEFPDVIKALKESE